MKVRDISGEIDQELFLQLKRQQKEDEVTELKKDLKITPRDGPELKIVEKTYKLSLLAQCYKDLGDTESMCHYARMLIENVRKNKYQIKTVNVNKKLSQFWSHYKQAHILLAPHSFHHYLVSMEWEYTPEMRFYGDRIGVMRDWVKYLQQLEDGELDILGLSGPPRSGKTGLGEYFLSWVAGRHPEKGSIFATHTNGMAVKAMNDVYNLMTDEKRGWSKIFPGLILTKSAEDLWINITPKSKPNNYQTLYFKGIDSSWAGQLEASHLLYCDDLIRGIEEALNPTRLENAVQKYGVDISQRRNGKVKELHIATRWSLHDVVSTLETNNGNNPRAKFVRVPGLDENGESNFKFRYNPELLDTEHFNHMKEVMDPVSFECIIQQNPIERDGIAFPEDSLLTYEGVLPGEPDFVCAACDVAWGGGDYLSMPIGYCYEKSMDCYIHDAVHSDKKKDSTKPIVVQKIITHGTTKAHFEANNGGDEYADDIAKRLKEEDYRCAVTHKRAPANRSKNDRIMACSSEITASITDGSGWRLHFLSKSARRGNKEYELFMKHLTTYNQNQKFIGKQKDDAADATAALVTECLGQKKSAELRVMPINVLFGRR